MKHADTRSRRLVATLATQAVVTLACLGIAGWVSGTPSPTVARLAAVSQNYAAANCLTAAQGMGLTTAQDAESVLAMSRAAAPLREAALETELLLQRCVGYELAKACFGDDCLSGSAGLYVQLSPRKPVTAED